MHMLWQVPLATVLVIATVVLLYFSFIHPALMFIIGLVVVLAVVAFVGGESLLQAIKEEWKE